MSSDGRTKEDYKMRTRKQHDIQKKKKKKPHLFGITNWMYELE